MKEHIWYLRRHLLAREPLFVGIEMAVPGTKDTSLVGNGLHPDKEAHLTADQYALAEEIGQTLYVPLGVNRVVLGSSPLARAEETSRHMFVGMAKDYAANVLKVNINQKDFTAQEKELLSKKGLHKMTEAVNFNGLRESEYKNSLGERDDGNELVAEAYHKGVNPNFPGYAWMVQRGFEGDPRSESPFKCAMRGLFQAGDYLKFRNVDVILSATHQWNLEAITAQLTGNLGRDGNELFANAGGGYGLGGGFELRVYETDGKIQEAQLKRTTKDPKVLDKELNVSVDVLRKYCS